MTIYDEQDTKPIVPRECYDVPNPHHSIYSKSDVFVGNDTVTFNFE